MVKYKNFGGSGKPFSRRPPLPREECSFKGTPIKTAAELKKYLSGNVIQCLICGEYFESVSGHVANKHGVSVVEYRKEFGIPAKTPLITKALRKVLSDCWKTNTAIDLRKSYGGGDNPEDNIKHYLEDTLKDYVNFNDKCTSKKIGIWVTDSIMTTKIHSFAKKYKDKVLMDAIKRNQKYTYDEKPGVVGICANKGCNNPTHRFGAHVKRNKSEACCSRECADNFRKSKRLVKACKKCGRIMLLTKSDYNRISSCCGVKVNTKAKNSAIHFKDEV